MNGSTIGIKIADGSFYPVLEDGFVGRKKLTLTTVKENQSKVQIDLYQGQGESLADSQYIGSLVIENIPPAARGEPGIDLLVGVSEEGDLEAEASDQSTGEKQVLSLSLKTLSEEETYEIPEFEMDRDEVEEQPEESFEERSGDAEPAHAGESDSDDLEDRRLGTADRRTEHPSHGSWAVAAVIILGLALIAAIGVILFLSLSKPAVPPLTAGKAEIPAAVADKTPAPPPPAVAAKPAPVEPPAAQPAAEQARTVQPPTPTVVKPSAPAGLQYRIKRGDTLWDISSTFYRDPWMYVKLAKANSIPNPDLILAGTKILIPEN